MLKVSTKIRYALRVLVIMANKKEVISSSQLAEKSGVSPYYLRQILFKLEKNGVIESIRGGKGGYILKMNLEKIRIYDVFKFFGENIQIVDCLSDNPECKFYEDCIIRPFWEDLKKQIKEKLENTTIKDLLKNKEKQEVKN